MNLELKYGNDKRSKKKRLYSQASLCPTGTSISKKARSSKLVPNVSGTE